MPGQAAAPNPRPPRRPAAEQRGRAGLAIPAAHSAPPCEAPARAGLAARSPRASRHSPPAPPRRARCRRMPPGPVARMRPDLVARMPPDRVGRMPPDRVGRMPLGPVGRTRRQAAALAPTRRRTARAKRSATTDRAAAPPRPRAAHWFGLRSANRSASAGPQGLAASGGPAPTPGWDTVRRRQAARDGPRRSFRPRPDATS